MKRLLASFILAGFAAIGTASAADPELKTEDDKTIYALGLFLANRGQLAAFGLTPAELDVLKVGLTDGALGHTPKVDLQAYIPKLQAMAQQKMAAAAAVTAAAERKKGKEYLETIAAKPGIKKTGSGLLMMVTQEGTGTSPVPTDIVKVNYKGTTIDGNVFDSSEKHGGPSTFRIDEVVKCWQEALEFMKVGTKATVYCPTDLAYGDAGHGAGIPPGATIQFDMELIEIVKPAAAAPAPDKK
jgi:FKBP-type peptidyl-prolyl cis-trans isomerase FkpA